MRLDVMKKAISGHCKRKRGDIKLYEKNVHLVALFFNDMY